MDAQAGHQAVTCSKCRSSCAQARQREIVVRIRIAKINASAVEAAFFSQ
jgi:hypothetical protein